MPHNMVFGLSNYVSIAILIVILIVVVGAVAAHQIKVTDANRPWTSPGAAHHRTLCSR